MNNIKGNKWQRLIAKALHIPTTIILVGIATVFSILIFQNFYLMAIAAFTAQVSLHTILEKSFELILFIEVIASIKIYFLQNYHFPLRFFLYIGITDLIRHIIINRDNATDVLLITIGLLVLVAALSLLEYKNHYLAKHSKNSEEEHFEL
ncbi:phosphate-starvation-inducible PsiE family protein [Patescibacteria group bacterium]|nr:phosphate-starvation-inducible PsiE family protein [Patescibacteria group bacterium]